VRNGTHHRFGKEEKLAGYIFEDNGLWAISLSAGQKLYLTKRIPNSWVRNSADRWIYHFAQVDILPNGLTEIWAAEPLVLVVRKFNNTHPHNHADEVLFIRRDCDGKARIGTLLLVSYHVWKRAEGKIDHVMTTELLDGNFAPALLYNNEIRSVITPPNERESVSQKRPRRNSAGVY
jgi:hypothetical protein